MANGRPTKPKSGDTEHKAPKPGAEEGNSASPNPDRKLSKQLKNDADDPDKVRGALDDAAGMSRNLWLAFLSFGTFLVVTVGAVKHSDLLRESPIKLPLLDVDLPLFAFFWVAPLMVLIFHAYLLLNLKLMVDNVHRYNAMLKVSALKPDEEDNFRLLLTNFPFVQLLAGTSYSRRGFLGWLLATIVWITVVLGPLVLLLLMQLQFLPYHSSFVTWVQRIVIPIDLGTFGQGSWTPPKGSCLGQSWLLAWDCRYGPDRHFIRWYRYISRRVARRKSHRDHGLASLD